MGPVVYLKDKRTAAWEQSSAPWLRAMGLKAQGVGGIWVWSEDDSCDEQLDSFPYSEEG